jgi:hypothetical protein
VKSIDYISLLDAKTRDQEDQKEAVYVSKQSNVSSSGHSCNSRGRGINTETTKEGRLLIENVRDS